MKNRDSTRRVAYAPTQCRRYQLQRLGGGMVAPPAKAILRALRAFDARAELFWLDNIKRWALYRRKTNAAGPSEDILTREMLLVGPKGEPRPPGLWLLDVLRRIDKYAGGSISEREAERRYLKLLQDQAEAEDRKEQQELDTIAHEGARELIDYGIGNRRHYDLKV